MICRAGAITVCRADGGRCRQRPGAAGRQSTTRHQRDNAQWMAQHRAPASTCRRASSAAQALADLLASEHARGTGWRWPAKARALAPAATPRASGRRSWRRTGRHMKHADQTHPLRGHRRRRHERHRRGAAQPRATRCQRLRPGRQRASRGASRRSASSVYHGPRRGPRPAAPRPCVTSTAVEGATTPR